MLDASVSQAGLRLAGADLYHLSMTKKKVTSGKYFCEPQVRM